MEATLHEVFSYSEGMQNIAIATQLYWNLMYTHEKQPVNSIPSYSSMSLMLKIAN